MTEDLISYLHSPEHNERVKELAIKIVEVLETSDMNMTGCAQTLATVLGTIAGCDPLILREEFKQAVCASIDRIADSMEAERAKMGTMQ